MEEQQPGNIISPGTPSAAPAAGVPQPAQAPAPISVPVPQPAPSIAAPAPAAPEQLADDQPQLESKYQLPEQFSALPGTPSPSASTPGATDSSITWSASEYIAHQKALGWYLAFSLITFIIVVGIYFITGKDIISAGVIALVAIVFAVYAGRQPKTQQYGIDSYGIMIGAKSYSFQDFKSFSVNDEGAFASVTFMPLKRFMPTISVYFDPQDEDKIMDVISLYLPFEPRGTDLVDQLMKKIRF